MSADDDLFDSLMGSKPSSSGADDAVFDALMGKPSKPEQAEEPERDSRAFYRDETGQLRRRSNKDVLRGMGVPVPGWVPDQMGSQLAGAQNAMRGAATFLPDLLGMDDLSDKIGKNLPIAETTGTSDMITSAGMQYGAPAALGGHMAGAAKAFGFAPKAMRAMPWLAGGATDLVVATPDEHGTLGDAVGWGPTQIEEGDSNIEKRAKLAAEGLAMLPVTEAATYLLRLGRMVGSTRAEAASAARQYILKNVPEHRRADIIKELDRVVDDVDLQKGGYRPLSGVASNDDAVISIERHIAEDKILKEQIRSRRAANARILEDDMAANLRPQGDPYAPRDMFEQGLDDLTRAGDERVATATAQQQMAADELAGQVDDLQWNTGLAPERSRDLTETLFDEMTAQRAKKNAAFDKIDPEGAAQVSRTWVDDQIEALTSRQAWDDGRINLGDTTPEQVMSTDAGRDVLNQLKEMKKRGTPVSYRELQSLRSEISTAIEQSRTKGRRGAVKKFAETKRIFFNLEDDTILKELVDSGDTKTASDVVDAVRWYEDEWVPKFGRGPGQEVAEAVSPKDLSPASFAQKFVQSDMSKGGIEASQQLRKIIDGSGRAAALEGYITDYAVRAAVPTRGNAKTVLSGLKNWQKTHQGFLTEFPRAADQISDTVKALEAGVVEVDQLANTTKELTKAAKEGERAYKKGVAGMFLRKEPMASVDAMMASPREAQEVLMRLRGNENAKQGVRAMIGEWVSQKSGLAYPDGKISFRAVHNMVQSDGPQSKVLKTFYSDDEWAALQRAHNRLEMEYRAASGGVSQGEVTGLRARNELLDRGGIVLDMKYGLFMASRIKKVLRQLPFFDVAHVEDAAFQFVGDAVLDPKLMSDILKGRGDEVFVSDAIEAWAKNHAKSRMGTNVAQELLTEPEE